MQVYEKLINAIKKIIYASSGSVYGEKEKQVTETRSKSHLYL